MRHGKDDQLAGEARAAADSATVRRFSRAPSKTMLSCGSHSRQPLCNAHRDSMRNGRRLVCPLDLLGRWVWDVRRPGPISPAILRESPR